MKQKTSLLLVKTDDIEYHFTVECKKNVITNESIPTFEKEITTSFPRLCVHALKCSPF